MENARKNFRQWSPEGCDGFRQQLKEAHQLLVFGPEDRGPHLMHAACKRWYLQQLQGLLGSTDTYQTVPKPWDEVRSEMARGLKRWDMRIGNGVPYLYGIYKTKKSRWRPIAGVHKARGQPQPQPPRKLQPPTHPLHPLAEEMMRLLQVVLTSLEGADRVRMQTKELRAFWVVRSPQEFGAWVRTHLTELAGRSFKTVDFRDMYTNIEHGRLLERVHQALQEAWSYEAASRGVEQERLSLTNTGWECGSPEVTGGYGMEAVLERLRWLLENCFVVNSGVVRRQVRGIPMGLAPSPQLADLFCYIAERDFVEKTGTETWLNTRYLDDIFAADPLPSEEEYGMQYTQTSLGQDCTYIGVRVSKMGRSGLPSTIGKRSIQCTSPGTRQLEQWLQERNGGRSHSAGLLPRSSFAPHLPTSSSPWFGSLCGRWKGVIPQAT